MIRRPPRSTQSRSSAASDVYKRQMYNIKQAGWSFSSFGGASKVAEKFEAFAHDEYNKTEFKSPDHIRNKQRRLIWINLKR